MGAAVSDQHMLGDVLVQGAAHRHVDQLQSSTDTEHRDLGFERSAQHVELELIASWVRWVVVGRRIALASESQWVDVFATGEQEPIEVPGVDAWIGVRRKVHRHATGSEHAAGVVGVEPVAGEVAQRPPLYRQDRKPFSANR